MGESRDTASENRAVGLGHLVWPLVPARLLYFVAYTAALLVFCVYQADHILPLPCPLPAMDCHELYQEIEMRYRLPTVDPEVRGGCGLLPVPLSDRTG